MLVLDDVFVGGQQDVELPAAELRHEPTAQSGGPLHKDKKERVILSPDQGQRQRGKRPCLTLYAILTTDGAHLSSSYTQFDKVLEHNKRKENLHQFKRLWSSFTHNLLDEHQKKEKNKTLLRPATADESREVQGFVSY